jgi:hypothetical protein
VLFLELHFTSAQGEDPCRFFGAEWLQVPVGTSVRLLDKVFAKKPRLHDIHLQPSKKKKNRVSVQQPVKHEDEIDDIVSSDAMNLLTCFRKYRDAQKALGHPERPLSLQSIANLEPVHGREARRWCDSAALS